MWFRVGSEPSHAQTLSIISAKAPCLHGTSCFTFGNVNVNANANDDKPPQGCTLIWPSGLEDLFSLLGPGESGPAELGGWDSGAILAPGESCMLASWAAYSCCEEEERKPTRR